MTLGCSRSPVTVAVPRSIRSALEADFWPDPEPGTAWSAEVRAAVAGWPDDGVAAAGGGPPAAGFVAAERPVASGFAGLEVSARGSPASDCAVALDGLPVEAGVAPDGAGAPDPGGTADEAGCCATAVADTAQHRAIAVKVLATPFMRPPSGASTAAGSPAAVP